MGNKIIYCIDSIQKNKKNKTLKIFGWCFSEDMIEVPEIEVKSNHPINRFEVERTYRSDVNLAHKLSATVSCGFQIVLHVSTFKGEADIYFNNGIESETVTIDLGGSYPLEAAGNSSYGNFKRKVIKGLKYLKRNGLKSTVRRLKKEQEKSPELYQNWITNHESINREQMKAEINSFQKKPKISILVPVYNVEEKWLKRCIQSIQDQTYSNWELCLADDASTQPHVRSLLEKYKKEDERIKVIFREKNGHICEATNSALSIATGEFIALMDNDDEIPANALFEIVKAINEHPDAALIYSDEDKIDVNGVRSDPAFKPDFAPDLLLSTNYISHLGVYKTDIAKEIGGFRKGFEGAQDYDFVLRFTEKIKPNQIIHIAKVLYHWRMIETSTAVNQDSKGYAFEAGRLAVEEALERRGLRGTVNHAAGYGLYDVRYEVLAPEKVSIIIPTKNGYEDMKRCLHSIVKLTTYDNYEIIIADNGTTEEKVLALFEEYQQKLGDRLKVVPLDMPFNYSRINNLAAKEASGKYLLFLNNDTEVITSDWLEQMIGFCQFDRIGAVGAKLYYPNHTIQHAGVILGLGGAAGHGLHTFPQGDFGYFGRLEINVNYSAVTAACMMMKKSDFEAVGGFNEDLTVAFNDVDLCLRVQTELGKNNVWLHGVELYHFESQSRGYEDTPEKLARFEKETQYMYDTWGELIENDPYYNINLTRTSGNYSVRED